jgi:prepilin-type N-terminal cleavage/methylation domain-containing protein
MKKIFTGFTLVEIMISTVIFTIVMVCTGSLLFFIQNMSLKQSQKLELNEDIRWAQTHIMQEASQCSNFQLLGGGLDGFNCTCPPNGNLTWYWRGDNAVYGNKTILYYAVNPTQAGANSNRQELLGYMVNNPVGNVFSLSSGVMTVNMTLWPYTNTTRFGAGNRTYSSRMVIRTRN